MRSPLKRTPNRLTSWRCSFCARSGQRSTLPPCAAAPLGLIVAGPVAEIVGVGVWYLAAGIACVTMGISGFFGPALMGIEDGTAEGVA